MKHIGFLFISLLLLSGNLWGQSRSATANAMKIDAQSEKLRQATGWKQDILGNWISNQNAISDTKLDEHILNTVPQYFKWIQLISIKNGAHDIYGLLYENSVYLSSSESERRVHFYLMSADDYLKITEAISAKNGQTVNIHSPYYGYMSDKDGDYSSTRLLGLMNQVIANNANSQQYDFSLNAQFVDDNEVIRFRLPEKSSILSSSLNNSYFEVKLKEFDAVLLPAPSLKAKDEFSLDVATISATAVNQQQKVQPNNLSAQRDEIEDRNLPFREPNDKDFMLANNTEQQQPVEEINNVDNVSDDADDGLSERRSRDKAIISAPVATFANIEGWYHTSEGEWVNDDNHLYDFETVGRYEWRNFDYRGKAYLLLVRYEKFAGETYYLISKDDYINTLKEMDKTSMLKFPVLAYAGIGFRFEDVIEHCEKTLDTPVKEDAIIFKDQYLVLHYKLSAAKNVARFFMFLQECSRYGSQTALENCNVVVSNKIRYDDEPLIMSESMFSKMYYETSYNSFMDFIRKPVSSEISAPASAQNRENIPSVF